MWIPPQAHLTPALAANVVKVGYTSLTPVQKHALPIVMVGGDEQINKSHYEIKNKSEL